MFSAVTSWRDHEAQQNFSQQRKYNYFPSVHVGATEMLNKHISSSKPLWKTTKLEDSPLLISNLIRMLQTSKECGTGVKANIQFNETDQSPEITKYMVKWFQQGSQDHLIGKVFSNTDAGWTPTYSRMKLNLYLTVYTKTNSKWTKNLNLKI